LPPAVAALADAQRPLVWAGGGAVGASDAVAALAERLGAPIFTTYTARGVAGDHPLAVGLPPHLPRTGALWDQADAVVAVGSDLDGMSTQNWLHPRPPTLVAINVDPADAAKNYEPDVVVEGDAGLAADLAAQVDGPREPWVDLERLRRTALADLRRDFPAELRFLRGSGRRPQGRAAALCGRCCCRTAEARASDPSDAAHRHRARYSRISARRLSDADHALPR